MSMDKIVKNQIERKTSYKGGHNLGELKESKAHEKKESMAKKLIKGTSKGVGAANTRKLLG